RRVGVFALRVIGRVVLAVTLDAGGELLLQRRGVLALRIPVHIERLDLGAEEMIGAARAEFGQARGVLRVDEAQNLFVVLHGADETFLLGNLAAQPRQDRGERRFALLGRERGIFRAAKRGRVPTLRGVFRLDVGGRLLDAVARPRITLFLVVVPRDEAVLAHHDRLRLGI